MTDVIYTIRLGDEEFEVQGPDGLTDSQLQDLAANYLAKAKPGEVFNPAIVSHPEDAPAEALPANDSSALGSFMRGVPHDAFFNFDDEISSIVNAAGLAGLDNLTGMSGGEQQAFWDNPEGFWAAVRNNMGDFKAQREADEELHPLAAGSGRVAGVLSSIPRAATSLAARLPGAITARVAARPISASIVAGATGGALSGAGAGEEGTRAQSAKLGGATGAALGLGIAGGMELAPAVANYAKIFFNKASDSEAIQQIVKALGRDGFDVTSPSGILKLKNALQEYTGKPVSLADVGGAVRSRAGVGLRAPSEAQQAAIDTVRSRQAGQGPRIAADIRANVAPRTDVHALNDSLVAQRAQEAERLREAALFEDAALPPPNVRPGIEVDPDGLEAGLRRNLGAEVPETYSSVPAVVPPQEVGRVSRIVDDPELQQLARLPDAQAALKAALTRAQAERDLLAATGKPIDHLPDLTPGADLDVRTFDYLKRFLDDEVNSLYRRGDTATFKAGQAGQVKALRDAIRERLRTAVPEYGEYLDAYKGSSEMIEALEQGQKFDDLAPEAIAAGQADRSTAAQELYRVGAARNLLDIIKNSKDTQNAASRVLPSEEAREQLLATGVDPARAAALNKSIAQERTLNLLPQELAGAQTQQRIMAQADANAGSSGAVVPFNPGSPVGWAGLAWRKMIDHASVNRNAAVNNEVLPRLLETNPNAIDGIIRELEQQGNIAAARALRRERDARRASLTSGSIIGSSVALPNIGDE